MKLIIDIPEPPFYRDMYTAICENGYIYDEDNEYIAEAIKNGTPLPKGHGELKDADAMINKLCTNEASELFGSITCAEIMDFINDEKTIIVADKEERSDKE